MKKVVIVLALLLLSSLVLAQNRSSTRVDFYIPKTSAITEGGKEMAFSNNFIFWTIGVLIVLLIVALAVWNKKKKKVKNTIKVQSKKSKKKK